MGDVGAEDRAFICRLPENGDGPSVAIKDLIDVVGVRTTAGSRVVERLAHPAKDDAVCLAGFRAAGVRIVGKTNLHELAFGTTGVNLSFGTPVNPLDAACLPGGSSSGSAVAVATMQCELALGTDTGGSVRIPSACCGTAGLKTTYGRISMRGVWPLAPSLDTVGPMARDVAGLIRGMQLLDPNFVMNGGGPRNLARVKVRVDDARIDEAVDHALTVSGLDVEASDIRNSEWESAVDTLDKVLAGEAANSNMHLKPYWDELQSGGQLRRGLKIAQDRSEMDEAYSRKEAWTDRLSRCVSSATILALPTLRMFPPKRDDADEAEGDLADLTSPVSLAGLPAVVIPIPSRSRFPASLQLVGPRYGEADLLAVAGLIEAALREHTAP